MKRILLAISDEHIREQANFMLTSQLDHDVVLFDVLNPPDLLSFDVLVVDLAHYYSLYSHNKTGPLILLLDEAIDSSYKGHQICPYEMSKEKFQEKMQGREKPGHYKKIKLEYILSGRQLTVDSFVYLSGEKFLQVFRAGDQFSEQDVVKYSEKYNQHLYIKEKDFIPLSKAIIASFNKLKKPNLKSTAEQISFCKKSYEISKNLMESLDISPEVCMMTSAAVNMTYSLLKNEKKLVELLNQMLKQGYYLFAHSQAVAIIACGMAKKLGWDSQPTLLKLCSSAYLHDITLEDDNLARASSLEDMEHQDQQYAKELGIPPIRPFSEKEIDQFKNHPVHAAEMVQHLEGDLNGAEQIILQHHENHLGTGFPNGLKAAQIAPLSVLFIVAHELVSELFDGEINIENRKKAILKLENRYKVGNFKKAVDVLPLLFREKQKLNIKVS